MSAAALSSWGIPKSSVAPCTDWLGVRPSKRSTPFRPSAQLGLDPSAPDRIPCLPVGADDVLDAPPGKVDARTGLAAYEAVVLATRRALAGQFAGIVTAPLSKSALHAAGQLYPGHTELLAELCGVEDFAMMLYLPKAELPDSRAGLGVVHTTLHCALRTVPGQLTPARDRRQVPAGARGDAATASASSCRRSASAPSTRTPARKIFSATRRRASSPPAVGLARAAEASPPRDRCRPTRSCSARATASSTPWWRCTTIRDTSL